MQKVGAEPYLSTGSLSNQSDALTEIRIKNSKLLLIAHLNINSLRSKCDQLKTLVQDKINISVVTVRFLILSLIYQSIKYLFVQIVIS